MGDSMSLGFPQFAPLSTPLVKHLLERQVSPFNLRHTKMLDLVGHIEEVSQHLQQHWSFFEERVQKKRYQTYALMTPHIQVDYMTGERYVLPGWLRETLSILMPISQKSKRKDAITSQTLSVWSDRHLIRHRAWGQLEAQSVAGLLTARQLDNTRERFWLPSSVEADEPGWWCYSQSAPLHGIPAPIVPCPVPLPEDLPAATLLWTPWIGASWDPSWLQIGDLGAIRWAGATLDKQGRIQWNITEADLRQWDPEIVSIDMGFLKNTQEMLNGAAHFALLRLALTRLCPPPLLKHESAPHGDFSTSKLEASRATYAV